MREHKVILIDDDLDLLEVMQWGLKSKFHVLTFSQPAEALEYLSYNSFDAVVIDYHMHGKTNFPLYQELRKKRIDQPVLFLTGDSDPILKIEGLDLGVQDFLHKPISVDELAAHLNNRIQSYRQKVPFILKIKNLEINTEYPEVKVNGESISLTRREFDIVRILGMQTNKIVTKSELIKDIWGDVKVEENNVDTHLSNIRKKLRNFEGNIKTFKGFGYVMRESSGAAA